jgi:methyltransferase (TIGR00027 family)
VKGGRPSETARWVAAARLRFERVRVGYGDPAAEERLARDVAGDLQVRSEERMLPYLAARTRFVDRVVVSALERGIRQVVIAAAGYDGRAWRYARTGVRWFELDHHDTQRDKRERVARLGLPVEHVAFVAADFVSDPVAPALVARGLDTRGPSVMLCEGIAVYLDMPVLGSLLAGLRTTAARGSVLAISLSVASGAPGLGARRAEFREAMAATGEPARTVLTATDAETLLAQNGWNTAAPHGAEEPARARRAGFVVATPD